MPVRGLAWSPKVLIVHRSGCSKINAPPTLLNCLGKASYGMQTPSDDCRTERMPGQPARPNLSQLPQQTDLLDKYRALVTLGRIQFDKEQVAVVMQLRRLQKDLLDYTPSSIPPVFQGPSSSTSRSTPESWWLYSPEESDIEKKGLVPMPGLVEHLESLKSPKGLLLTGPPGSGKSFLVDLWYSSIPTSYKTRKHYNQLVLEIYRAVWEETQRRMNPASPATDAHVAETSERPWSRAVRDEWRKLLQTGPFSSSLWASQSGSGQQHYPPMAFTIARRLILSHWLLVFDEIQLLDVSSACLLADVLSWFWRMGGVVVGTSNKIPEDLYQNGVQRERLEPFVDALKTRCPVLSLNSGNDWREVRGGDGDGRMWFVASHEQKLQRVLEKFGSPSEPQSALIVFGRPLEVPWVSGDTAKFSFNQLCDESLGPADYLTLASNFRTIIITDIPILNLSAKNQARRFISLIDAQYEARCRLICFAEAEPQDLFFPDAQVEASAHAAESDIIMAESVAETRDVYRPNVSSYDAPRMEEAPAPNSTPLDTLSIFSGKDEQFAFKRALSRLIEMTSAAYARDEVWNPLILSDRKWEALSVVPPPYTQMSAMASHNETNANENVSMKRPVSPRLTKEHVWGVRDDWGDGAKEWGRGAKAYEKKGS